MTGVKKSPLHASLKTLTSNDTAVDCFYKFFPKSIFSWVSDQTNLYASQFYENIEADKVSPRSRYKQWTECTPEDIQAMTAIEIGMGFCRKTSIEQYFSETCWVNSTPNYANIMSRDRYQNLRSFLHFANNNRQLPKTHVEYDPLFKIRPIIDTVKNTYLQEFEPGRSLSVDESMLRFKGRLWFKQYMPSKPSTKWGVKLWSLCDSETGFLLRFDVYVGKGGQQVNVDTSLGLGERVVRNLLLGFENTQRIVYCDNFFSSPSLFQFLRQNDIGACGTVRPNRRGMPTECKPSICKLKKGEKPKFWLNKEEGMIACTWQDTGRVTLLSTVNDNDLTVVNVRTKNADNGYRSVAKPKMVLEYNKRMNGVDRFDQLSSSYSYYHKNRKWYHVLWHFIVEAALVNGKIAYNMSRDTKMSAVQYRNCVIEGLLEEYCRPPPKKKGRICADIVPMTRLSERHFIGLQIDKKHKPNCIVCSIMPYQCKQGGKGKCKRKQTIYICKNCPEQPPLCPVPCFEDYHTKKKLQTCLFL